RRLTMLSLVNTGIQDVSPLANHTNLVFLDLSYNTITNLSRLTNSWRVQNFSLDMNGVSDLSFVTNFPLFQSITFRHNAVSDFRPLMALPHLQVVDLYDNGLDLSPGSSNAAVIATLQGAGVEFGSLVQSDPPVILPGWPLLYEPNKMAIAFSGFPGK